MSVLCPITNMAAALLAQTRAGEAAIVSLLRGNLRERKALR